MINLYTQFHFSECINLYKDYEWKLQISGIFQSFSSSIMNILVVKITTSSKLQCYNSNTITILTNVNSTSFRNTVRCDRNCSKWHQDHIISCNLFICQFPSVFLSRIQITELLYSKIKSKN